MRKKNTQKYPMKCEVFDSRNPIEGQLKVALRVAKKHKKIVRFIRIPLIKEMYISPEDSYQNILDEYEEKLLKCSQK